MMRRTTQSKKTRAWIAAAALALVAPACMIFGSPGPSNVAQGQQYESGHAQYDPFFQDLFAVQVKMADAPERERDIRTRFARKIGAKETATPSELGETLKTEAARLAKAGTTLKLKLENVDVEGKDPATAELVVSGKPSEDRDEKLVRAIETAAKAEAEILSEMRAARDAAQRLGEDAAALIPGIDNTLRLEGPAKRAEVRKNLEDAQALIPLMIRRAKEVAETAEAMLDHLYNATNTGPSVDAPGEPGEAAEDDKDGKIILHEEPEKGAAPPKRAPRAPKPAARPAPRPAPAKPPPPKPAAPPPPPKPAAKPAPPPADDFEP